MTIVQRLARVSWWPLVTGTALLGVAVSVDGIVGTVAVVLLAALYVAVATLMQMALVVAGDMAMAGREATSVLTSSADRLGIAGEQVVTTADFGARAVVILKDALVELSRYDHELADELTDRLMEAYAVFTEHMPE